MSLAVHQDNDNGHGRHILNLENKTAPQFICDLIIARTYNRAVRSNNSFALVVPMIKLKHYGERSFSYAAPVEWNKLDV